MKFSALIVLLALPVAAPAEGLLRAESLIGAEVVNPIGEKLGIVEELVLDTGRQEISFAVIGFGGFIGLSKRHHVVPWRKFAFRAEDDDSPTLVLDASEAQFKRSLGFDGDDWPNFDDDRWTSDAYRAWELENDPDERSLNRRLSDWEGLRAVDENRRDVGEIKDVVIAPQDGKVVYALVERDDDTVAVPWDRVEAGGDAIVVGMTAAVILDDDDDLDELPAR